MWRTAISDTFVCNMHNHTRLIACIISLILLWSCKKDEGDTPPTLPDPNAPGIKLTTIKGTNSTLQATYFSTIVDSGFIGKITYIQGWAHAYFRSSNGATLKPAMVSAEGTRLTEKLGKYASSPGNTQGIDYGSAVIWQVQQTPLSPAINETLPYKVPEIGDVNLKDSLKATTPCKLIIDNTNPFTNLGSLDSISYLIRGKRGSLLKKMNTLDTAVFTVDELRQLGTGKAYIQAEAYRYEIKNYNGYKVAYINKGVLNKVVWIY